MSISPQPPDRLNEPHGFQAKSPLADILAWLDPEKLTDAKRAMKFLQAFDQPFASFMEHLPGFAWIKNLDGQYVYVNQVCELILPPTLHADGYIGKMDTDLFPPEIAAEYRSNDRQVIEGGAEIERVETVVSAGQRRSVLSKKFPIFDSKGKVALVGGVAFDITRHLEAERELRELHTQLRALTARLQSTQEEASRRIAREIHDELGEKLTTLNMECQLVEKRVRNMPSSSIRAELLDHIAAMYKAIEETLTRMQRICSELRPGVLDDLGLIAALECHAADFEARTHTQVVWIAKPASLEVSQSLAITVFRVFQEILTNVARHAAANQVRVAVTAASGRLILDVTDNGQGIAPDRIDDPRSLGLLGMRERALLAGGKVEVAPSADRGTLVRLELPLSQS